MLLPHLVQAQESDPLNVYDGLSHQSACRLDETKESTLSEIINVVWCQNPRTKKTFYAALSTADEMGTEQSKYQPKVDLSMGGTSTFTRQEIKQDNEKNILNSLVASRNMNGANVRTTQASGGNDEKNNLNATLSLNWLIYDFGAKQATYKKSEYAMQAALKTYNNEIQSLMYETISAYFNYFAAKDEYQNSFDNKKSALETMTSAKEHYNEGMVPYSDQLQAETTFAEADLMTETAAEKLNVAKSKLAVLLNLDNPSADLKIAEPSASIDYAINENFNDFLDQAFKTRADLQALENTIRKNYEEVTLRKKDDMPTLKLNASASANDQIHGRDTQTYTGSIGITLNVPLYTGFSNTYKINKAKHDLERSKAEYEILKQQIGQDLWATFQSYMTAKKSYEKSLVLLRSAQENADVAQGSYNEGHASILEVLSANSKLADAKTSKTKAYYTVIIEKANLYRQAGVIETILPQ